MSRRGRGANNNPLPSSSKTSLHRDIEDAVCNLALVTGRQLDEASNLTERTWADHLPDKALEGHDDEETEHFLALDDDRCKQRYLDDLQSKLLDRLAEILARFKDEPKAIDAKHVASTILVVNKSQKKAKIICAKNEGLDKIDETFLEDWKLCMEAIATEVRTSENNTDLMFRLVLEHQKPRITTYINWLRCAFGYDYAGSTQPSSTGPEPTLTESSVREETLAKRRTWTDDKGLVYEFPAVLTSHLAVEEMSEAALTGQSFASADGNVKALFQNVMELCKTPERDNGDIVKQVMRSIFYLWREARTRSAIKAHLYRCFGKGKRQRKEALKALLFLSRIYNSVLTFIKAAETLPVFHSIEWVAVPYLPPEPKPSTTDSATWPTCLQSLARLGIHVRSRNWLDYFRKETPRFQMLLKQKRCKHYVHAEIQTLQYHDLCVSHDEGSFTHPYIGCSRRCCWLCYSFILLHGHFRVRGSHETIMHRWGVAVQHTAGKSEALSRYEQTTSLLLQKIKYVLANILKHPRPLRGSDLLAQSSAAISSAQITMEKESAQLERSVRELQSLMMMPIVHGDSILVTRNPINPARALVIGGQFRQLEEMTMGAAELLKDNLIRSSFGLERVDEMPPIFFQNDRRCRLCHTPSSLRCSSCRTSYCSRSCQAKDWRTHLFVCCVKGRPDDTDRLWLISGRWRASAGDAQCRTDLLMALFADDHLCKTFGFNNCVTRIEVAHLFCLYRKLLLGVKSSELQYHMDCHSLGEFIYAWIGSDNSYASKTYKNCSCTAWFMEKHREGFDIPNYGGSFAHQVHVWSYLNHKFRESSSRRPSMAERNVISLYAILLRDFNDIPRAWASEWLDFGFCFCRSHSQRVSLASAYRKLLNTETTISEIAAAWEKSSLGLLMKNKGIDVGGVESDGIRYHRPSLDEFGSYRLVAEVQHALLGYYCPCFISACQYHSKHENLLSMESEGDYGFHGVSPWERWQLLNFYARIFEHPDFDPHAMHKARRDPNPGTLEEYLNSLLPGFRNMIRQDHVADAMFPKLNARIEFPNGRPPCECVIHTVLTSEGLDLGCYDRMKLLV